MGLTRAQKKALKLALMALNEVAQNRHKFNANLYRKFGDENLKKHHLALQNFEEATKELQGMLQDGNVQ